MRTSQKKLLHWYENAGRHSLPWRCTSNLYHIYLSEIMLQQTQVNRVMEFYYSQFLKRFPSLEDLAEAPLDDVLSAWSGLGYYRRARNLHNTAKLSKEGLPQTLKELKELPGIGAYTASAICSFGLSQSVPVVDTNIARVLKRHFALLEVKERRVWEIAEEFLNTQEPRAHNLALMDLGSMICTPKNPNCKECPLYSSCEGSEEPELYTRVKKKEYVSMELYFGVYIKEGKIAMRVSRESMYKDMLVLPSVDPLEENYLGSFKHSYTKYKLDVKLYTLEESDEALTWVDLATYEEAPISSLSKKAKKFFKGKL